MQPTEPTTESNPVDPSPRSGEKDLLRDTLRDQIVLLCDDVCTTGATLNACAEQLLAAGVRKVCAATIAKDIPHREVISVNNLTQ